MPNSVRVYDNTMSGSPSLSGTVGSKIGLLKACLEDGFGSVTVNSLVVASNFATATVSAGHQFAMIGTTGPVIRISGASPSGLNSDVRITVVSPTVFTFPTTGISDQTATGTITAKRAPAGFSTVFSGTNKAVYRSDDITGTRLYLRVDDNDARYPGVVGYESMTTVDSGTNAFRDTISTSIFEKSDTASSSARAWVLIADSRLFYLFTKYSSLNWAGYAFGDILSFKAGDAFGCWLLTTQSSYANEFGSLAYYTTNTKIGSVLARSYTQTSGVVAASRFSHSKCGPNMGYLGMSYPSPVNNGIYLSPVEIWENLTVLRGLAPGLYMPLHSTPHGLVIENVPNAPGKTFVSQQLLQSNRCAIDITGPWRSA